MVRRTLALVTTALVLAAACGTGPAGSGVGTPVSEPGPSARGPALDPTAGGPVPDLGCEGLTDLTVSATEEWRGPVAEIAPDCSGIDPEPFRVPTAPLAPLGPV